MSFQKRLSFPVLLVAALGLAAAPASASSWRGHDGHDRGHRSHAESRGHGGGHYDSKRDRKHYGEYGKHDRKHYRKHGKHEYKHYRKHDYKHHRKHAKRYHKRHHDHYVTRHAYGYPVHHYANAYYCAPCSHYFGSYELLSTHAHHHHGIAWVQLPSLIFQASIGGGAGFVFGY